MKYIDRLVDKYKKALRNGRYADMIEIQKEISMLRDKDRTEKIQQPVRTMMSEMSGSDKKLASSYMVKMFVYADLLDGMVTDFHGILRKYDPSVTVMVTREIEQARKHLANVIKVVDDTASDGNDYSAHHAAMCDEVGLMVGNVFNKYRNKV